MPTLKLYTGRPARRKIAPREALSLLPARAEIQVVAFDTELGCMAAEWQGNKLSRLTFGHDSPGEALEAIERLGFERKPLTPAQRALMSRLQAFARGTSDDFADVPVLCDGLTDFAQRVVNLCRKIGYGKTLTYGQLAAKAGSPGAARAVGNVMANNRIPLVIPCHRVVGSAGSLGGFSAPSGIGMKQRLLEMEGAR